MSTSDLIEGVLYQKTSLVDGAEILRKVEEGKEVLEVAGHLVDELAHHHSL